MKLAGPWNSCSWCLPKEFFCQRAHMLEEPLCRSCLQDVIAFIQTLFFFKQVENNFLGECTNYSPGNPFHCTARTELFTRLKYQQAQIYLCHTLHIVCWACMYESISVLHTYYAFVQAQVLLRDIMPQKRISDIIQEWTNFHPGVEACYSPRCLLP